MLDLEAIKARYRDRWYANELDGSRRDVYDLVAEVERLTALLAEVRRALDLYEEGALNLGDVKTLLGTK